MAKRQARKFKHPKTGATAVAVLPREVVNLEARGFREDKPQVKPQQDAKS